MSREKRGVVKGYRVRREGEGSVCVFIHSCLLSSLIVQCPVSSLLLLSFPLIDLSLPPLKD